VRLFAIIVALTMCGARAEAQQTQKIFRIGYLDNSTASNSKRVLEAFRQELTKLGWIEGKNITIEYRFAEQKTERLPELAADLVRLKVDLIVVTETPVALAAKRATAFIPVVMTNVGDPWVSGWLPVWRGREAMSRVFQVLPPSSARKGWRYSRTQFPSSAELDFCERRGEPAAHKNSN
jgi:ABC-type uncharacterized transport system substrate-binding protein